MKFNGIKVLSLIVLFIAMAFSFAIYQDANAACFDDPNKPNNGWCVPAPGGQACESTAGSCNCTCDIPPPIIV